MKKPLTLLTGIKTTGIPHLGNLAGAILPSIESSEQPNVNCYYFLADYHALINTWNPDALKRSTLEVAAAWLAFGLNPDRVTFYRQSDVPQILELTWILSCMTAKGLMNRAHAYKAAVADNETAGFGNDPDRGITMGLYNYPVLMSADILMFKADLVPVGRDQLQHLEMARDIAARFNHHFGDHFILPEAQVKDETPILPGLDGRKMSKSYGNIVPLFRPPTELKKLIMRIKTDSAGVNEPKDPETSTLFLIYRAFATRGQTEDLAKAYAEGIGWGEVKQKLFTLLDDRLDGPRNRYNELVSHPERIEVILQNGAQKARAQAQPFLQELREAMGLVPLN